MQITENYKNKTCNPQNPFRCTDFAGRNPPSQLSCGPV